MGRQSMEASKSEKGKDKKISIHRGRQGKKTLNIRKRTLENIYTQWRQWQSGTRGREHTAQIHRRGKTIGHRWEQSEQSHRREKIDRKWGITGLQNKTGTTDTWWKQKLTLQCAYFFFRSNSRGPPHSCFLLTEFFIPFPLCSFMVTSSPVII